MTERDSTDVAPDRGADIAGDAVAGGAGPIVERDPEPVEIHAVAAPAGDDGRDEPGPVVFDAGDELAAAEAAVADDISRVMSERDNYLDSLRRLQADFENYKKRVVKQQTEHLERAAEDLVVKLLPVLDTAELARAHGGGEGVEQITAMLSDLLAKEGLEPIDATPGTTFDPMVHEAVAHEPGDGGDPEVSELMRAGYRWRGRLVRPAMVKVKG